MDYAHPFWLKLRGIGQRTGILRPLVRLYRKLQRSNYEDNFEIRMMAAITTGSVVWDVGANVGFYTEKFVKAVGPAGYVVAFEPAPSAAELCSIKLADAANFRLERKALSNIVGSVEFLADSAAPTNRILSKSEVVKNAVNVEVLVGDQLLAADPTIFPNFIKIDVEGYEHEVLEGLQNTLKNPKLTAVFLEMHFLELAKRGKHSAPREICELLRAASLGIQWVDPSHLIAHR